MLKKLKYYFTLAIKKPYLIPQVFYKKHLGVIISIPIQIVDLPPNHNNIVVNKSTNINEIGSFYKKMNRDSVNQKTIKSWLENNYDCFLVRIKGSQKSIGAMWIFKGKFTLKNLSGRTLSSNKNIKLNDDSLYGAMVIVDEEYRGRGINQYLLNYVVNYYYKNSDYKKMIIITGATNGAYIRSTMKINAKLIGITQITNILGIKIRRELFLDKKEKSWSN